MDLSAIQRRVKELSEQKSSLDGLDTAGLTRIAEKTYEEVETLLYEGIKNEWYVDLIAIASLASYYIQKSRYKSAFEKLGYAKAWLDNAKSSKSDSMKRIALKQSFSDSAHALQIFAEEANKGSTPAVIAGKAKDIVNEEIEATRKRAIMAAIVATVIFYVVNQYDKR